MSITLNPAPSRSGTIAFGIVRLIVVVAAVACGAYLGVLAQLAYSDRWGFVALLDGDWGIWAGAVSGGAVALAWSWLMTMRARERQMRRAGVPKGSLVRFGIWLGMLAGCVAGICVHVTIQSSTRCFSGKNLVLGLVFGAATGIALAFVGSILVWFASLFAPGPR